MLYVLYDTNVEPKHSLSFQGSIVMGSSNWHFVLWTFPFYPHQNNLNWSYTPYILFWFSHEISSHVIMSTFRIMNKTWVLKKFYFPSIYILYYHINIKHKMYVFESKWLRLRSVRLLFHIKSDTISHLNMGTDCLRSNVFSNNR